MSRCVLIVDDEPRFRALYTRVLRGAGFEVIEAASAEAALAQLAERRPDMVVSDVRMPGASGLHLLGRARAIAPELPFLLVTAFADVRDAVAALKLGAVDYLAKPVDLDELLGCVRDALGDSGAESMEGPPADAVASIVAESPAMRAALADAWRVARSDVNVLLTGESGTGKEVVARFMHRAGDRSAGPFVAVNCAAQTEALLTSTLFGHEKGAFTGAVAARRGRFREADGGILFLDEIGDMPLNLQPVLLRALEQRTVTPVGGSGEHPVDFRLVAATNRPLEQDVAAGRFRADLYYRLDVVSVELPPLRERPEDILPLARRFISEAGGPDKRLARATTRLLCAHGWPGNVRELQNAMQRARLLSRTDVVLPESLPPALRRATAPPAVAGGIQTLRDAEITSLRRALAATGGNRTRAAELLGITRRGLLKKLKRLGLQDGGDP